MSEYFTTDLTPLFTPRTIAVVGAHDTRPGLDQFTLRALEKARSCGARCYLVNPKLPRVFDIPTYPRVADVPEDVDVLVVLVGQAAQAIEQAAVKRPKFAIVFAGGYREVGTPEGERRQQQLVEAARLAGTRVLGPNTNTNTLEPLRDLPGPRIGLITQSGMQGRPIAQGQELGVALSGWAVTGNEADLEAADFVAHFSRDPHTQAIAAYVEGFCNGDALRAAALDALETQTPLVLIKVGRSSAGAAAGLTHTGHLAGSDAVHDAVFRQYGITRVDDLDELLDVTMVLSRAQIPDTGGVALLCTSGGSAAHIADLVAASGLPLPELTPETQNRLRQWIPAEYQVANPVDNGGVALLNGDGPKIAETMLADQRVGVMFLPVTGVFEPHMKHVLATVRHAREVSSTPVVVIWQGPTTNSTHQALLDLGVPVVRNVRHAIRATQALFARREFATRRSEFHSAARGLGPLVRDAPAKTWTLDEVASTTWLEKRGLRFAEHAEIAGRAGEAVAEDVVAAATRIGYPVVLKAAVPEIVHKTEAGLVTVGLADAGQVRQAVVRMTLAAPAGAIKSWIVARQLSGGVELLVGLTRDPQFGPVITLGAGGVRAEALRDVSLSVLPLTRDRAADMLTELRIAPQLEGWRGAPPVDRESVVDLLMTLARIATQNDVEEIEVNPLLALPDGAVGLDAVVRLRA
jgi:acetate---CoA ligase (ADP-forming)